MNRLGPTVGSYRQPCGHVPDFAKRIRAMDRNGNGLIRPATGDGPPADHPAPALVPEAEVEAFEAGEQGDGFDGLKEWFGPVAAFELVVGDARAEVVDVVETDIA